MIRLIIKNKTFVDRNVVVNFKPGECMRKSFFSQQRKWLVRQNPSIANGSRTYDLLKNVLILWLILFFFPQKIWTEIKGEISSHKSSPKRYNNFALSCIGVEENLNKRILFRSSNVFVSSWQPFFRLSPKPSIQSLSEYYFILLTQILFRPWSKWCCNWIMNGI